MGFAQYHNVRLHSGHVGSNYWLLAMLALSSDDDDRHGHFYIAALAADMRLSERPVQRAMRHLESSGELIVYDDPGHPTKYEIPVLPVGWPESYECHGKLMDRRKRQRWTPEHQTRREEIGRESARKRSENVTRRTAHTSRQ